MNIAVFGMGYVGSVSAACLAAAGHRVTGVEVEPQKLALLQRGQPPVMEPSLDEWMAEAMAAGRLRVTDRADEALGAADLSLLCVGTPSRRNGSLDSTFLERVVEQIGMALSTRTAYHVVAVRSTLLPGVLASRLIPLLEAASGRRVGVDIGVCVNPEFLREGSAISDFEHPPFTLVGETDRRAGDLLLRAYRHLQAPVHRVRPDEASMVKYASNIFHAVKIGFANEIGAVCQQLGLDGQTVMRVFCEDHDLNISPRYLRPGFGFGGSCLPKDLRAIVHVSKELDVAAPLLTSVLPSNDAHIQRVVDAVLEQRTRRVALLGLSFKSGSDDLRESPFVRLAESLIGKGVSLRIYDPDVALDQVVGRNRSYVEEHLPHVGHLVGGDLDAVIGGCDVVVVGKRVVAGDLLKSIIGGRVVIDLVGIPELGAAIRPWAGVPAPVAAVQTIG
jgi:GDP-mannose 6-dehydrogenase